MYPSAAVDAEDAVPLLPMLWLSLRRMQRVAVAAEDATAVWLFCCCCLLLLLLKLSPPICSKHEIKLLHHHIEETCCPQKRIQKICAHSPIHTTNWTSDDPPQNTSKKSANPYPYTWSKNPYIAKAIWGQSHKSRKPCDKNKKQKKTRTKKKEKKPLKIYPPLLFGVCYKNLQLHSSELFCLGSVYLLSTHQLASSQYENKHA